MTEAPATTLAPRTTTPDRALAMKPGQAAMVCLPSGHWTLVKQTNDGLVKCTRVTVQLSEAAGHTYSFKSNTAISARGYDEINRSMGVSFHQPEDMLGEDGKRTANPCVYRDEHGAVKRICIRCIGFGRNAMGNLIVMPSTLDYDLEPAFAQDALKKWRKNGPKKWGNLHPAESVPDEACDSTHKCVHIPGGYVLSMDLANGDVLDIVEDHAHRVRFATRNAETIVKRNILKRFAGREKLDDSLCVDVVSWQTVDHAHLAEIAAKIKDAEGGKMTFRGERVEVADAEFATVNPEADEAALVGSEEDAPREPDDDPTPGVDVPKDPPAKPVGIPASENPAVLRTAIRVHAKHLPADNPLEGFLVDAGIEKLGDCEDVKKLQAVRDKIMAANAKAAEDKEALDGLFDNSATPTTEPTRKGGAK